MVLKIRFRFLVISRQSSKMAAQTTFPKKDGKRCALVPQKARAWAVTPLEININSRSLRKICTFLARFICCLMRMAAHYEQDQKEPYFSNEESPD